MKTLSEDNFLQIDTMSPEMNQHDATLGAIVAKDWRKAEVFRAYDIDFCCGGKRTLAEVCKEKGLDLKKVELELQTTDHNPAIRTPPYNEWSLDFLCDYIINTHHSFVKKSIPAIRHYAAIVFEVHGNSHPELATIHQLVEQMSIEMIAHMDEEENKLFPYIKLLVSAANGGTALSAGRPDIIQKSVEKMETEHEFVGKKLAQIRLSTNNYTLPADRCSSYSLLFKMLEEFESDLHLHVHLENNILFPKALGIESRLTKHIN